MASHFLMSWNRESMTNAHLYRLTPDAQSDLIAIRRYTLVQWGSAQSKKYLSELRQIMSLLSVTPKLGTQRSELGAEVFSFSHSRHVIYYQCLAKQLIVFGILHKRMLPMAHLEDRETS
jgi:toxin ParE1/3/4